MVQGLENIIEEKEGYEHRAINMAEFGSVLELEDAVICYGCAATAACEAASGVVYDSTNIDFTATRATASGVMVDDQDDFEDAMDSARKGWLDKLFHYMGRITSHRDTYDSLFYLGSYPADDLKRVKLLVQELKEKDI